jgi:hypothetical protein
VARAGRRSARLHTRRRGNELDLLLDLGLPGIVFLGLCLWLVRKAVKAARTESDLESHRLEGPLADELAAAQKRAAESQRRNLAPLPDISENANANPNPDPLSRADFVGADPLHLALIAALIGEADVQLLWARSTATHAVWCERRAGADVLRVIRVDGGKIVNHWSFGEFPTSPPP